jgi:hypothetical protein
VTEDAIRDAFRTGLGPFLERVPNGPDFDHLVRISTSGATSPPPSGWRRALAAAAAVLVVGVGALLIQFPSSPTGFDPQASSLMGEQWWGAVVEGDSDTLGRLTHPDAAIDALGLREMTDSLAPPLDVTMGTQVLGTDDLPQLCYILSGAEGEHRGSLVYRLHEETWLVYEVRTGASGCVAEPQTTTTRPPPEFHLESFLQIKLRSGFENPDWVALVVLSPLEAQADVEALVVQLPELEGFVHVPSGEVRGAAIEWARIRETEQLQGEWIAFGLIPQFNDSPIDDWLSSLSTIAGIHVAKLGFDVPNVRIPEDWRQVATLPFAVPEQSIIRAVDEGIIVLKGGEPLLVGFDGSWASGEPLPAAIPTVTYHGIQGLNAGGHLVLVSEAPDAWILDVATLTWTQTEPRPTAGYVLGSAMIDGDLYIVTAAARTGEAMSTVAILDLGDGAWRALEPVPRPISVGGVATDGTRLFVSGVRQGPNNNVIGDRNPVLFEYTPGTGWTQLASIPIDGQASTLGWAGHGGLLAWNYDMESALLSEQGTWEPLTEVPMAFGECSPSSYPISSGVVGIACGISIFDASSQVWQPVTSPGWPQPVVTSNALYSLIQLDRDTTVLLEYRLD